MILLKIDKGKGFYLKDEKLVPIVSIEPGDLVVLIGAAARSEETIELDDPDNIDGQIVSPIEKTIYEEVYKALIDLVDNRETYLAQCQERLNELEVSYGLERLSAWESAGF